MDTEDVDLVPEYRECAHCGHENPAEDTLCIYCGRPVDGSEPGEDPDALYNELKGK